MAKKIRRVPTVNKKEVRSELRSMVEDVLETEWTPEMKDLVNRVLRIDLSPFVFDMVKDHSEDEGMAASDDQLIKDMYTSNLRYALISMVSDKRFNPDNFVTDVRTRFKKGGALSV
jgi:hypothetical protein